MVVIGNDDNLILEEKFGYCSQNSLQLIVLSLQVCILYSDVSILDAGVGEGCIPYMKALSIIGYISCFPLQIYRILC